jgi:hypothetical protein
LALDEKTLPLFATAVGGVNMLIQQHGRLGCGEQSLFGSTAGTGWTQVWRRGCRVLKGSISVVVIHGVPSIGTVIPNLCPHVKAD